MKKMKLTAILLIALLVCAIATGCGKKDEGGSSSPDLSNPPTASTPTPPESVTKLLEDLKAEKAAPSEFIKLAKEHAETADADTARLLVQAIFEAQKDYPAQTAAAYETANANADFSALYAIDTTPDLAAKITDENIRKTVEESYANGFKLSKAEGYIFPIIDMDIYETSFFSYLSDADAVSLKKDIEEFNKML